jgi:uncharacterized membrane protein
MLYVGAYQVRAISHLACPIFGHGCEAVADAPFARPAGIPNGFIAFAMYAVLIILVRMDTSSKWVRHSLQAVALLAGAANILGVADMAHLGAYCFYCVLTTAFSPVLALLTFGNLEP